MTDLLMSDPKNEAITTRVAVLFGETLNAVAGRAIPGSLKYLLSFRDPRKVRDGVTLRYRPVWSANENDRRPWLGVKNLNTDDLMSWLREDPHLGREILCPTVTGDMHIVAILTDVSPEFVADAQALGLSISQGRDHRVCSQAITSALVLKDAQVPLLVDSLSTRHPGALVDCAILGTVSGSTELVGNASSARDLVKEISEVESSPGWIYTLRFSHTPYDALDPQYRVSAERKAEFERAIREAAVTCGYEFYSAPLTDNYVMNWIGFGELPLLGKVSDSVAVSRKSRRRTT